MARQTNAAKLGIAADNDLAPYVTKRRNYLLRSKYAESQRRVVALASAGRIVESGHGMPIIIKADGSWAGNCNWNVEELKGRGLIERATYLDPTARPVYRPTRAGHLALEAALRVLDQRIDPPALLASIDAGKVW